IEDEPEDVYAQLVATGIHWGMNIQLLEITPERVRIWGDGEEQALAPIFARNISVVPLTMEEEEKLDVSLQPLSALQAGERGTVVQISRACRGLERRRLMDFGVVPGTVIEADMQSLYGGPTAYHLRATTIALRKEQADKIFVTRQQQEVYS
ncbi:MAG: ferrous iron transport protein A, partial [Candidatus Omnitrophota bacterium]